MIGIILNFGVSTLLVYLFYFIFMINKYDKDGKLKKKKENKFIKKIVEKIKSFLFGKKDKKEETLLRGRKNKKIKEEKDDIKIPTEVEILIIKYHIDLSKINYKKLLKIVGMTCSIDVGLIITILSLVPSDNIYIQLLIGAILIIPTILISYAILGNYFKKKGLVVTNDKGNKKSKRNRK
ncbi:MAG: hypothetical protein IJN90_01105 [Bacilli bacterium]|nr:hypothetical protein [Bacilli bacterium]